MGDDVTGLTAGYEDWRHLVEAALKGRSFDESLVARSYDGIDPQPIYGRAMDAAAQPPPARRGAWDIVQRVEHPDLDLANALIRADLDGGATGIELVYPASPNARGGGLNTETLSDLDRLLDGVALDKVIVRINGGHENRHIAALLVALAERRGVDPAATRWQFARDPIGYLAVNGRLNNRFDIVMKRVGDTVRGLRHNGFEALALMPDGRTWHAAGASEAQELALLIASATGLLKALEDNGLALEDTARLLGFCLAADADQLMTIAKVRALRRLWARVQQAAGLTPVAPRIHAETAWRMMTARAPYVNIARATLAAFAAGVGGADSITVLPFTAAIGLPDAFARRVARNTQNILIEEANAHRVVDPAAGSGALEALSEALARKAWELFVEIERTGGIFEAVCAGRVRTLIGKVREARARNIATRKELITGVSDFADLDEKPVAVLRAMGDYVAASNVHLLLPEPGGGHLFEALLETARAGGSLADMVLARGSSVQDIGEGLPQIRLSEPFEALRAASDGHLLETGARPRVFMANLGAPPGVAARAAWAKNIFALGGIIADAGGNFASPSDAAEAFRRSGARIACVCSSDEIDRGMAEAAGQALRAAGARALYVVGEPGAVYAKSGIGSFLHVGCNVLELLGEALGHATGADD